MRRPNLSHPLFLPLVLVAALGLTACGASHDLGPPRVEVPVEKPATEQPPPPKYERVGVLDEPKVLRDWDAIVESGVLRVLVQELEHSNLSRTGSPIDRELALLETFARTKGLSVRYVVVTAFGDLDDALLEGRGDLIAAEYSQTPSRARKMLFSAPVRRVDELVVAAKGAENPPRSVRELGGRKVWIKSSSSFAESIAELSLTPPPRVVPIDEDLDGHAKLERVASGVYPLTVVDSDAVDEYVGYADDVAVVATLKKDVPIAWPVHPKARELHKQLNGFLEGAAKRHGGESVYEADLEEIVERGILRVAMPNNSNSYFFFQGQPMGFHYSVAQRLAERIGVRLEVVVARRDKDLIPLLLQGRADVVAAVLTDTEQRREKVAFSQPLVRVDEMLVQPADEAPITRVEQLKGREVHVRRSSAYWQTLSRLAATVDGLKLVPANEELETEELIAKVGRKEIPLTVADYDILSAAGRPDVKASLAVGRRRAKAFAARKGSDDLLAVLDEAANIEGKKLSSGGFFRPRSSVPEPPKTPEGARSPWDDIAKKYGRQFDIDWLLIVAIMKAESSFDPNFQSWVGAQGLMQVMPHVLGRLGLRDLDLEKPEDGVHAGARYFRSLLDSLAADVPDERERIKFALAAYRVGLEHIGDARRLAKQRGLDPTSWSDNVSEAIVLLSEPEHADRARYGYCRGIEARDYVEQVMADYKSWSKEASAKGSK